MSGRIGEVEKVDENSIQVSLHKDVKNVTETTDYSPYGIDSRPQKGAKVFLMNLGARAWKIMMGVRRKGADKKAKPGETRLYDKNGSEVYLREDGSILIKTAGGAMITLNSDGTIEVNGNAKSAMNWTDFNVVWSAFITHMDAHIHTDPVSGVTGVPTVPTPAGAADMSSAENTKVKFNDG